LPARRTIASIELGNCLRFAPTAFILSPHGLMYGCDCALPYFLAAAPAVCQALLSMSAIFSVSASPMFSAYTAITFMPGKYLKISFSIWKFKRPPSLDYPCSSMSCNSHFCKVNGVTPLRSYTMLYLKTFLSGSTKQVAFLIFVVTVICLYFSRFPFFQLL
jgi:hypothetical protein